MELASILFPHAPLQIIGLRVSPAGITIIAEPTADRAACPSCGARSGRIHSRCTRRLQDLPAHGRRVQIQLHLRRFFCDLPDCPQQTFAEQVPELMQPRARRTTRQGHALREIGFSTGGEAGSRLAGQLNMPASGDTLLRLMRRASAAPCQQAPAVLGVDEWAWRKGQRYGTILCDLQSHRPVDLLPQRSSESLALWLRQHPGVQIISRDRGSDYAKGASDAAPAAVQVADRWHLLHNLTDALQRAIDRRQTLIGQVTKELAAASDLHPAAASTEPVASGSTLRLSRADRLKQQSRQRRLARYQRVRELLGQGMSLRQTARTLGFSRNTVERFAAAEQFPERATPTPRPLSIDIFVPYLKQRWEQGCDNASELWRQIRQRGFTGSVYSVRRLVRRWRRATGRRARSGPRPSGVPRIVRPSARRLAWLALGHAREPTAQDQLILQALYRRWPQLPETAELCRQFAGVLKRRESESLEAWVQLAGEPTILPEVRRFAEGLGEDWAAVVQAAGQPWSQGQTEGQINRLKLIKRQMYGRAGFDLLRQRVLHARPA